jgi:IclR family pca regulon transcriptional regulator
MLEAYLSAGVFEKLTPSTVTDKDELRMLLKSARELGYSIMSDELELGLRSVAVPLRDSRGRVVAAMSVSTYSTRETSRKDIEDVLPPLRATAEALTANIAANHIFLPTWTGAPHRGNP